MSILDFDGYKFVIDEEIDFIMLWKCYENGCNCFTCSERHLDGCIIDEVDLDILAKLQNETSSERFDRMCEENGVKPGVDFPYS